MEDLWLDWFLLVSIFGIAVASPGPDFIITVRNSVLYSRKIGVLTAIGIAAGVCVHLTYVLFGISALISQSILFFNLIKYAGAAYLFYIGFKALRSRGFQNNKVEKHTKTTKTISAFKALWIGFLTNVLNPKATLFFMSVVSQFISPETTSNTLMIYGLTCIVMTGLWFSIVAVILTNSRVKATFLRFTKWIDRVCGMLLIALGIKLALSKAV